MFLISILCYITNFINLSQFVQQTKWKRKEKEIEKI